MWPCFAHPCEKTWAARVVAMSRPLIVTLTEDCNPPCLQLSASVRWMLAHAKKVVDELLLVNGFYDLGAGEGAAAPASLSTPTPFSSPDLTAVVGALKKWSKSLTAQQTCHTTPRLPRTHHIH